MKLSDNRDIGITLYISLKKLIKTISIILSYKVSDISYKYIPIEPSAVQEISIMIGIRINNNTLYTIKKVSTSTYFFF